jgi:hypothetical protein
LYYSEKVYVALDNADDTSATETVSLTGVTMTINASNYTMASTGMRVAVYYTDSDNTTKLVGAYAPSAISGANVVTSATGTSTYNFAGASTSLSAEAGTVTATAGQCYFTVYVYLDGENTNVYTDNIKKTSNLLDKLELTFGI